MEISTDEQSANGLGVVNGTQLSNGSIGTAPHTTFVTFLSSDTCGVRTDHEMTHMQVLNPQSTYFPAALKTKPPHATLATFLSSGTSGVRTDHELTHMKVLSPQST